MKHPGVSQISLKIYEWKAQGAQPAMLEVRDPTALQMSGSSETAEKKGFGHPEVTVY